MSAFPGGPAGQLAYRVSGADRAGGDDPGIQAAQPQLAADPGVDEPQRIGTEPAGELGAAEVRLVRNLDDRRAQGKQGSRRQVGRAQVEIDVELITGQHAPVKAPGDEQGSTGVHHCQLHVWMWRAVSGAFAPSGRPGVANEARHHIEHTRREHLTLVNSRPAHDQLDRAAVRWRIPDVAETGLQRSGAEMFHITMMPPPAPGHELFAVGAVLETALGVMDVGYRCPRGRSMTPSTRSAGM